MTILLHDVNYGKTVVNAQLQKASILNNFSYTMVNGRYLNTSYLPIRFKRYHRSYMPFQLMSRLPSATPMKMKKLHPCVMVTRG